jgi:hypothetical protein
MMAIDPKTVDFDRSNPILAVESEKIYWTIRMIASTSKLLPVLVTLPRKITWEYGLTLI